MTQADSLSMDYSRFWNELRANHVTAASNRIGREEVEFVTNQDEDGDTLLHIAVAHGNVMASHYLAAVLLNTNSSLDIRNNIMQTPLHVSCLVDNPDITRLLLRANPESCDVTDRHGNNCVHLAVKHSSVARQHGTLKAVLEVATSKTLEKKNLYGYTPLHIAAIEGKAEAIRLLNKAGANINALDNRGGAPPLILATRASQREAAQALLELGANPTLRTTYGETASQLASAKADHVISELLALYDSPCDVMKANALPRYANSHSGSSNRGPANKQVPSRNRDVNMKPFVNVTSGFHANIHPLATAIRHVEMSSTSSPQRSYIKNEPPSPAHSFPSNSTKSAFAISNNSDESSLFISRRAEIRRSDSPTQQSNLKRKNIENDSPLDLSVKKAKQSDVPSQNDKKSSPNPKPHNRVFVRPAYLPASSLDRSNSHVFISTNRVASTSTASLSSNPHPPSVLVIPPHSSMHGNAKFHQYVQYPDSKAVLSDYKRRSTESQPDPSQQRTHKPIPENGQKARPPKNGIFYPLQVIDPALASYHEQVSRAYVIGNTHLQQPVRKASPESRDKEAPFSKWVDARDQNQPIVERVLYARDQRSRKHHPTLEHIQSLPNNFHARKNSAGETSLTSFENSNIRDRRYQSEGACYDFNRFLDKQSASRRNSAPVPVKSNNVKLDLRSYTGCLPPHYLHLLESSGNLPTRPSNALRNVVDVLRDNFKSADLLAKRENTEKKKIPETPDHDLVATSRPIVNDVTSASSPSTTISRSIALSEKASTLSSSPILQSSMNYFAKLGDWSGIESGDYPAFGNPPQLESDKIKLISRCCNQPEYKVDEKYISEKTQAILKKATLPTSKEQKRPCLRHIMTCGSKHSCLGCSKIKKKIPPLVADIWRYKPTAQYVTSAIASSEVVYCSQLDPKKSEKNSGEKSKSELYQAQSSPSSNRTAPPLTSETRQPSNFVKTEQTNLDQRSGTKKLLNCDDDVTVNGNARDDMLANVIEASDDDDNDEVTKTSPILNGHTPNLTTRGGAFPVSNGFHSSLSEVIKKTLMQNLERHSDVVRKLRTVQALLTPNKKECVKDTYKDYHISDLEISDDEEIEIEKSN